MSLLVKRNSDSLLSAFPSIFSDLFQDDHFFEGAFLRSGTPAVNVKENNTNFEIELAAPGLKKEDFKVDVRNGVLFISSKKKEHKEENYTRKEFSYSSFERAFTLPENVDNQDIKAKYKDGVLNITLKKKELKAAKETKSINVD
jgi:HSP20 family protein